MKKLVGIFCILLLLCTPIFVSALATNSSVNYSINVNVFYEDNCKECEKVKKWLEDYKKDDTSLIISYFNVKKNKKLNIKVKEALDIKRKKVPLIIIGSNYFVGFNDKVKNNLIEVINAYEKEDKYCDIVTRVENNKNIKDCININKDIYNNPSNISMIKKIIIVVGFLCLIMVIRLVYKKKKA